MKKLKFILFFSFLFAGTIFAQEESTFNDYNLVETITTPEGFENQIGQISRDGKNYFLGLLDNNNKGWIFVYQIKNSGKATLKQKFEMPVLDQSVVSKKLMAGDEIYFNGQVTLSSDELTVVFSGNFGGTWNGNDLYIATRPNKSVNFSEVKALENINNPTSAEAYPCLSPDALRLYYTFNNEVYMSQRASVTDEFTNGHKIRLNLEEMGEVISCWVSDDEKSIVLCNGSEVYTATRVNQNALFSIPQILSADFSNFDFVSSVNIVGNKVFIYNSETVEKSYEDVRTIEVQSILIFEKK